METTTTQELDLTAFDVIVLNTSGGKDSSVMVHKVARMAERQGVPAARLVAVHADLGRVEWEGVRELAERQVARYGIRFMVCRREQGDLLEHIEARGMFPSSSARFCTSDHKRDQVAKVITALVREHQAATGAKVTRVLNVMGLRAQESTARARKVELSRDARLTNSRREVTTWLPILDWTEDRVWGAIKVNGLESHQAYAAGMPRLSCTFCVLGSRSSLVLAAQLRPALAQEYLALEQRIGHTIQNGTSMADIIAEAEALTAAGELAAFEATEACQEELAA